MGKVTIEVRRNPAAVAALVAAKKPAPAPAAVNPGLPEIAPEAGPVTTAATTAGAAATARPYRITYTATNYVPDPSKRYTVRYRPNALAEDDINVQVGKDSLLDLIDVTSEDKSVEAAKKLIEIGKNVFRIAAQGGIAPFAGGGEIVEEVIFVGSFDPTSPGDLAAVNRKLRKVEGGPYEVSLMDRSPANFKQVVSDYRPTEPIKRDFSGVAFRPALAYDLVLARHDVTQEIDTVLLPNEAEVLYMPITRSAFVKKIQKLDFDQGMLVQAVVKKPSEVVGGLEIPLEITRAILALPGEIAGDNIAALQRRQNTRNQELLTIQSEGALSRGVLNEQILNMDQQMNVLRKQEEFLKEKKRIQQGLPAGTPPPNP